MQIKLVPFDEYTKIHKETLDNVYLMNINCTLKFAIDKCFDGSTVTVYRVVEDENQILYAISLEMLGDASLVCIIQSDSSNKDFVRKATQLTLKTLQTTFDKYETFLCSSLTAWVAEEINIYFDQTKSHPYSLMDQRAIMFYATKKQQEELIQKDLSLPPEFEFRKLEEEDAHAVSEEVVHVKSPNDIKILQAKISHFPSIGIYHQPTNQLASYAMNDGTGLISYLYTRKQFRRLGLAKLLEQKLALENMEKHQVLPFKAVAMSRPRVVAMSKALYLWSVVPNVDGSDLYGWVGRSKTSQPEVVFYED